MLTVTVAIVTANAYYIHPIIGEVAASFGISDAQIGLVPALNQLALALGILLLLPLGDFYSNKKLTHIFVSAQCLFMAGMALSKNFALFTLFSTLLGFVTIAPYLVPAYASKRVAPERLGRVTALLTTGVIFGILVARVGAGIVAEHFGWRTVYYCAFALMVAATLFLPIAMRNAGATNKQPQSTYGELLLSVFVLAKTHKDVLLSALIQGLNFATFTASWLALALHLTSEEVGYSVDRVGYLAGAALVSLFATPFFGRFADRIGALQARLIAACLQTCGILLLYPFGSNIWTILLPLLITNGIGPSIDVTGRMTFLTLDPNIRTRLTTIYIVIMFLGGALGSVAGTFIYDQAGWGGTCLVLAGMSLSILAMSFWAVRISRNA